VDRNTKEQIVQSLNNSLANANCFVVLHYQGLTVEEITNLRKSSRKLGAHFKVTKNSLLERAVKGTKFDDEKLKDYFSGPTAISFSEDAISAAKAIVEYSKGNEKITILAGMVEEEFIDVNGVKDLATLPSIDEIRAKLVGLISAPASSLARLVNTPAVQLARVFGQYANKQD
jgi:large subunit ribosomal protein L10